ncbi:hypothetical protein P689_122124 [Candidatus Riesia pediculischaeffi PTSU]|uniref:Uncharacterized protein n=1 Tax=Candidatus Riesia pediculischaeffi PTSU TaxID=1401651 RepID=A0A0C1VJD4_9ENTR|nr:hypothetical protein P689_122124 [Candidatus Riesia pediculischaeffi PTSU]
MNDLIHKNEIIVRKTLLSKPNFMFLSSKDRSSYLSTNVLD